MKNLKTKLEGILKTLCEAIDEHLFPMLIKLVTLVAILVMVLLFEILVNSYSSSNVNISQDGVTAYLKQIGIYLIGIVMYLFVIFYYNKLFKRENSEEQEIV